MKQLRLVSTRRVLGAAAAFVIASCSGDGCGCTEPTPNGFPSAERTENAIQVRVTPTGLEAIEADPAALIGSFLGTDDGAFPLPATCGGDPELCCDNGQPIDPCGPVNLDFALQPDDAPRLEINTVGPGQVQIVARMRIKTGDDIPVSTSVAGVNLNCDISIDTTAAGGDSVSIVLDVGLAVNEATGVTELVNVNANVGGFDDNDLDIDGNLACDLADSGIFDGIVVGQLEDALEGTLEDAVAGLACKQCPSGDVGECGEFADACDGEVCMRQGACLQELGLAGRVIGDKAFAGFSSGQLGAMDIYEVAGGYANTDDSGVSLGVLSGAIPAGTERDRCGPSATAPPFAAQVPISSFFTGNVRPDTNNPFGVGIGIHQYNLDLFSYSAYESGLLCLNIGASAVDLLTAETFSLVMPSLLSLAHNQPAPVTLGLRPQSPPIMTLGAGTVLPNGDIDEPLINLEMPGLEIDFYAMIDEQFIRVMTLTSDVTLPINLEANDSGQLTPVIGDTTNAFANLGVKNSEALSESPDELAAMFPALLDLALPMLAGGLEIDLPLLGSLELRVQPDGITSIEANSILAIFADLAVATPSARSAERVETNARIVRIDLPERSAFSAPSLHRDVRPTVTLELGGSSPRGAELEWSVRLNEGLWMPYSSERTRTIESDVLWLQGRHEVEVRAREVGRAHTTDAHPVALALPIDKVGPSLEVRAGFADQILVSANDYVDKENLTIEYQLGGGPWQRIENLPATALVAIDLEGHSIEETNVRALDSNGNTTYEGDDTGELGEVIGFHGAGDGGGCECNASGGPDGGWLLAALALLLAFARRRRQWLRRGGALVALAAIALFAPACSCGEGDGGEDVEAGPTGRYMSSASNGDRTVLAAYDDVLGDLVLIDVSGDGELSPVVVDGIPDGADATLDPGGYRRGIAPAGPNVGAWTSVALEGSEAFISYQDLDTSQLKFARGSGDSFVTHVVDGLEGELAGFYTSTLIRNGAPTVAYQVVGADGADGVKLSQLRMATASSASPGSSDDWSIQIVDETPISCAGLCGDSLACVEADAAIGPACTAATADCAEPCGDGDACVAGACLSVLEPPANTDLTAGTGLFNNNLTLADGRAAVVFYRRHSGDLVIAVENGGAWEVVELDAAGATDTGASAAATLGTDGAVHVAYQDAVGDRVKYLATDGSAVTVAPEFVDEGVRASDVRSHPVGAGMAISDEAGVIVIAYQDGLTSDLVVSQGGPGAWSRTDLLTGATLDGFYNRIAKGVVATYSYDRALPVPGTIIVTALP